MPQKNNKCDVDSSPLLIIIDLSRLAIYPYVLLMTKDYVSVFLKVCPLTNYLVYLTRFTDNMSYPIVVTGFA